MGGAERQSKKAKQYLGRMDPYFLYELKAANTWKQTDINI